MAATAWAFYNAAKHKLAIGTINLSAGPFRLALYKTAATAPADLATITIQSQISTECSGGAYAAGGRTLAGISWGTGASNAQQKFDCTDPIITASGSAISAILFGVIVKSVGATSGFPLCFSQLSTAAFDVTTSNTVTITMAATGIFTLA